MNITDAFLICPPAMEAAQAALTVELSMLQNGIGRKKRIEWLIAQRDKLIADAVIVVPMVVGPVIGELSTRDTLATLQAIDRYLVDTKAGSTFRDLRSAQRRNGLPENFLDNVSSNGAIILLQNDAEFMAAFQRVVQAFIHSLEKVPAFQAAEAQYNEILQSNQLESVKQQQLLAMAIDVLGNSIEEIMDDLDVSLRDIVYVRGRIMDQSIMASISEVVRVTGASIFDSILSTIITDGVTSYRNVIAGLINERIYALSSNHDDVVAFEPPTVAPAPPPSTAMSQPMQLLTTSQAMALLKVSRTTLYRLTKSGSIEGVSVGRSKRITFSSIERYLDLSKGRSDS